jgi:hypothetical protein
MGRFSGEARSVQQAKQCLVLMPGAQALAEIVGGCLADEAHASGLRVARGSVEHGAKPRPLR